MLVHFARGHRARCRVAVRFITTILVASVVPFAWGADQAAKCEATKLKTASKYGACRLKAEAKGVLRRQIPEFLKCDEKFDRDWDKVEARATGLCPTEGDEADISSEIVAHSDLMAFRLSGATTTTTSSTTSTSTTSTTLRFEDTGLTVIDHQTRLEWEKKVGTPGTPVTCLDSGGCPDPHNIDNRYEWCADFSLPNLCDTPGAPPDGPAFILFLDQLNNVETFAGFSDWRLPTRAEYVAILDYNQPPSSMTDPGFAQSLLTTHWTGSEGCSVPPCGGAWTVNPQDGAIASQGKEQAHAVRAVRGPIP